MKFRTKRNCINVSFPIQKTSKFDKAIPCNESFATGLFIGAAMKNNGAVKRRGTGNQLKQCPKSERIVGLTLQLDYA